MSKKYELMADKSIEVFGKKLFRIRALWAIWSLPWHSYAA